MTIPAVLAILWGSIVMAAEWRALPALPDPEGFAGPFAGATNGALLVAGGANFPGKKPWEGGKKAWYDDVFVLEHVKGPWKFAGKLSRPLGYGVSVSHVGVVCVGGSDALRHYADAFRLEWRDARLVTTALPALPRPVANACGALLGDLLLIAGGQESPSASVALRSAYLLDLAATAPAWKEIEALPGNGRMLAVAAAFDGAFWVAGGVELHVGDDGIVARRYLRDAYRYVPGKAWERIADLPGPMAAAPSPAPVDASGFLVLGGDDGAQVKAAPGEHRGFSKRMYRYDRAVDTWTLAGEITAARVTAPCVAWNGSWVVPSGEARPGVRSPEVWALTVDNRE